MPETRACRRAGFLNSSPSLSLCLFGDEISLVVKKGWGACYVSIDTYYAGKRLPPMCFNLTLKAFSQLPGLLIVIHLQMIAGHYTVIGRAVMRWA